MKKIYLAAPLFSESERIYNIKLKKELNNAGFYVHLPQEDGVFSELATKEDSNRIKKKLFDKDIQAINNSDIILFLLDGRVPDEGGCVELGYAYATNKKCFLYKTDSRIYEENSEVNLMIEGCCKYKIFNDLKKLIKEMRKI